MIYKKYIYIVFFLSSFIFSQETPELFEYDQSTLQAFYFVQSANIYGEPLETDQDWVGIFKNDVCVGSWPWQGDGNFTTVPAMGDDGSEYSFGYMNIGDFPVYKIYDGSEDAPFIIGVGICDTSPTNNR